MIKAIVFDCFGVLTTEAWLAFVDSLPDGVDIEAVREVHRAYTAGLISKEDNTVRIRELSGKTFTELEDMHPGQMAKNTALLDYIRELKKRGYKIGLLSNIGSNWIRDEFLTSAEQGLFDDMVLSYEVGLVKPDPRIFRLVCERLGIEPAEVVLVDDIERYCTVAHEEGLGTIQYIDFKQAKSELEHLLV